MENSTQIHLQTEQQSQHLTVLNFTEFSPADGIDIF